MSPQLLDLWTGQRNIPLLSHRYNLQSSQESPALSEKEVLQERQTQSPATVGSKPWCLPSVGFHFSIDFHALRNGRIQRGSCSAFEELFHSRSNQTCALEAGHTYLQPSSSERCFHWRSFQIEMPFINEARWSTRSLLFEA
jgi:hypothetical protein